MPPPFPGIPEEALAGAGEPHPFDLAALEKAVAVLADPPEAPLRHVLEYGRLLLAANTVVNLTGAKSWEALIGAHLLDAVRAAAFVPEDARFLADWGTGAGLPGIVWAILFPEKQVRLVERSGKKVAFLREAVLRLELFNAEVLEGQGEEVLREPPVPDLVVARAVEPFPRFLARLRRNRIKPRSLALMLGPRWEEQWEEMGAEERAAWSLAARHPYELDGEHGSRCLVVLRPRSAKGPGKGR